MVSRAEIKARTESRPPPNTEVRPLDISFLDILTDATRIHFVPLNGMVYEYVPLTIAEEQELAGYKQASKDDGTRHRLAWMLAKAVKRRLELFEKQDQLTSPQNSVFQESLNTVKAMPTPLVVELLEAIGQARRALEAQLSIMTGYAEKNHFEKEARKDSFPRDPSPLDSHLGTFSFVAEGPFSFSELASLTQAQYLYFSILYHEQNIRGYNNHAFMVNNSKSGAPSGGKKKGIKKTRPGVVGSE